MLYPTGTETTTLAIRSMTKKKEKQDCTQYSNQAKIWQSNPKQNMLKQHVRGKKCNLGPTKHCKFPMTTVDKYKGTHCCMQSIVNTYQKDFIKERMINWITQLYEKRTHNFQITAVDSIHLSDTENDSHPGKLEEQDCHYCLPTFSLVLKLVYSKLYGLQWLLNYLQQKARKFKMWVKAEIAIIYEECQ